MKLPDLFLLASRLKPITYKITNGAGYVYRKGFAVDFDLPVHVCIYQRIDEVWYAEEFLTGCSIGNTSLNKTSNMVLFLQDLYLLLQEKVESGQYAKSVQLRIERWGKHETN